MAGLQSAVSGNYCTILLFFICACENEQNCSVGFSGTPKLARIGIRYFLFPNLIIIFAL